jgi:hypothetical protein
MWVANISKNEIKFQIVLFSILVVCMLGWYFWPDISSGLVNTPGDQPIAGAGGSGTSVPMVDISGELQNKILPENLNNAETLLMGKAFIYPSIFILNRSVYAIYGLLVVLAIGLVFLKKFRQVRKTKDFITGIGGLSRNQIFLVIAALLFLIVSILFSKTSLDLTERGLTMAILCISGIIVSITGGFYSQMIHRTKRLIISLSAVVLLFLSMSFPIVSYSIDAYSSFPISEEKSLVFTAERLNLENKTLADSSGQQMVLFNTDLKKINSIRKNLNTEEADVYIIRSTGYYYAAMRFDFSFEDNRITRYQDKLKQSSDVVCIYVNPSTSVYVKR